MNTSRNLAALTPLEPLVTQGKKILQEFSSYLAEEKLAKSFVVSRKDDSRFFVSLHGLEIVVRVELYIGKERGIVSSYVAEVGPPQGLIATCGFDHLGNVFLMSGQREFSESADSAAPMFVYQMLSTLQSLQTALAAPIKLKV